ncbi:protocadherin beta-2 [Octopus bimaculoides]|uniref:protocadherin beta-2 n=1 Tax=Octopus bimaculoides TaxID=37653 RepID=UPI00071C2706|nr:protocadherin beta-2 [Octopus bimaculoides]|eukprot:XP_014772753.1 PREDICTED: protocadherin beta-2-like [Octopus bimaculoides]
MECSLHIPLLVFLCNNNSKLVNLWLLIFIFIGAQCLDVTYHVDEQKLPGTYIGNIAADTHLLDYKMVTFSNLKKGKGRSTEMFNVSKSGELYTAKTLDAETLCKYNSECYRIVDVAVQNMDSFIKILEVKVIINDINDHQPEFPVKNITLQFDEGDKKGMVKFIPNAIDRDVGILNSQITYMLERNVDDPFKLSVSKKVDGTAKLGIVLDVSLDREIKDIYNMRVKARDGGTPSRQGFLDIHINVADLNDNPPVFSKNIYNVSLENTHHFDTPLVTMSATDLDSGKNGKFLFHINSKTSNLTKTYFRLDPITGEIFLNNKFSLEKRRTYKLFIEASDNGSPPLSSTAIVLINIINQHNNAPSVEVNFFSESTGDTVTISEGIKIGSFIAYVKVTDNDSGQNGEVSCDLYHDKVQLQSLGRNKYKVVIKNLVDREREHSIDFTITCRDKGSPPLHTENSFSVQVMDVNDVRPQFTKDTFRFLTYENEKINFPVGFINATDQDEGLGGQLSFYLEQSKNHLFPFQISDFGFILTTESLDREQQDVYEFKVLVKDNGTPSLNNTANVIVEVMDENDNAPYFSFPSVNPFSLDVHYHPQSKNDITVLKASDRDSYENAFLKYEILSGNDKQLFTVNPYSGVLSFSRTVYQNDAGSYELQFVVKDSGTPVLSAKTTMSLMLTVSNKTTKLMTTVYSKSDKKIHINLFIIILVAILIVSIAIVVSITMCIVRRNNQRAAHFANTSEFVDESRQLKFYTDEMTSQSGTPVAVPDIGKYEKAHMSDFCADSHSGLDSSLESRKVSASGIHCQATTEGTHPMCIQKIVVTPDGRKYKETAFNAPCRYNELSSTPVPYTDRRHNLNKRETGHYEELSAHQYSKPDKQPKTSTSLSPSSSSLTTKTATTTTSLSSSGVKSSPTLSSIGKPKDIYTPVKSSVQSKLQNPNSLNTDVIDLKSISEGHSGTGISSQLWDLPMKNSFTSLTKPLPAVPKRLYQITK